MGLGLKWTGTQCGAGTVQSTSEGTVHNRTGTHWDRYTVWDWERTGQGLSGTWDSMVMVLGHRWAIPHEAAVRVYVYMQMWCFLLTVDFQAICLFAKTYPVRVCPMCPGNLHSERLVCSDLFTPVIMIDHYKEMSLTSISKRNQVFQASFCFFVFVFQCYICVLCMLFEK